MSCCHGVGCFSVPGITEVVRLKVAVNGKGGKDRDLPLSPVLLEILRACGGLRLLPRGEVPPSVRHDPV